MTITENMAVLARSAATVPTAAAAVVDPAPGANLIINGGMTVSQRGTSFTGMGASNVYLMDRWFVNYGGTVARFTATQSTDVPSNGDFAYSMKVDCTTIDASMDAADLITIETRLEGQDLQHLDYGAATAKTATLSFWFKSAKTGVHCVFFNTGVSTRSYIHEFTIAVADTWEEFSVVIPGDASGVIANANTEGLRVGFTFVGGSNYQAAADTHVASGDFATSGQQNLFDNTAHNYFFTGVKLEVGSSATAFQHEPYGDVLARCQRYLCAVKGLTNPMRFGWGYSYNTTVAQWTYVSPVSMRATPTLSHSGTSHFAIENGASTDTTPSNLVITGNGYNNMTTFSCYSQTTGLTAGQGCLIKSVNTSAAVYFSSEL